MLNDTEPLLVPDDEFGSPAERSSLDDSLHMEVEQYFSISSAAAESRPKDAEIRPSETRMRLASAIGERGNISVEGRSERLVAESQRDGADSRASQQGASVSVDLSYDTSADGQFAMNAYFNRTDRELAARATPDAFEQQQQTWGYDARWSRQIDSAQRVAVALAYLDTSLNGPGRGNPALDAGPLPDGDLSNQTVGAEASYHTTVGPGHDVKVAMRTDLMRRPANALYPASLTGLGDHWTVQAEVQDTWALTTPFALVYAVGYKEALTAAGGRLVVPRVGGNLALRGWHVRGLVSYHSVGDSGTSHHSVMPASFRPVHSLGYEAEVEIPLARNVRLRGGTTYAPIQFAYFGYLQGGSNSLDDHPLYLTDGNSSVQEHRLSLVEERGITRTYFELAEGRAEGTVAPLLPFDGVVPVMGSGYVRYRNGRLGFRFPTRGTDLRFEYRRVDAESADANAERTESSQESFEVRVKADVPTMQVPGDWRVLVALRLANIRSDDLEAMSASTVTESVSALNRRISAGVAVLF